MTALHYDLTNHCYKKQQDNHIHDPTTERHPLMGCHPLFSAPALLGCAANTLIMPFHWRRSGLRGVDRTCTSDDPQHLHQSACCRPSIALQSALNTHSHLSPRKGTLVGLAGVNGPRAFQSRWDKPRLKCYAHIACVISSGINL